MKRSNKRSILTALFATFVLFSGNQTAFAQNDLTIESDLDNTETQLICAINLEASHSVSPATEIFYEAEVTSQDEAPTQLNTDFINKKQDFDFLAANLKNNELDQARSAFPQYKRVDMNLPAAGSLPSVSGSTYSLNWKAN